MMTSSTRTLLSFGLISGLTLAFVPSAFAQIAVTGGTISGQGAFFVPGSTTPGNTTLFDATVKQVEIQSANGTLSTGLFKPTAASFTDNGTIGPNAGDTGVLAGKLAGVGFVNGSPIPFQGVNTRLEFVLNSFTAAHTIPGTLISPPSGSTVPLIYLPNIQATLAQGSTFTASQGDMKVGAYDANLSGGLIGLPTTIQFTGGGTTPTPPPSDSSLERRIKFQFAGQDVVPEAFEVSEDKVDFVGEANKTFSVQTVGTQGEQEVKLQSTTGAIDISINKPFASFSENGTLDPTASTTYNIKGDSTGIFTLTDGSMGFAGSATPNGSSGQVQPTEFAFTQAGYALQGSSKGDVSFTAIAGTGALDQITGTTEISDSNLSTEVNTSDSEESAIGSTDNLTINITINNLVNSLQFPTEQETEETQQEIAKNSDDQESASTTSVFSLSGSSSTSQTQYELLSFSSAQPRVIIATAGVDRYFFVVPAKGKGRGLGRGLGHYKKGVGFIVLQQVGPSSSVFPGLIGLQQLPPTEAQNVQAEVGLSQLDTSTPTDE